MGAMHLLLTEIGQLGGIISPSHFSVLDVEMLVWLYRLLAGPERSEHVVLMLLRGMTRHTRHTSFMNIFTLWETSAKVCSACIQIHRLAAKIANILNRYFELADTEFPLLPPTNIMELMPTISKG